MKDFKQLKIWHKGIEIVMEIYKISKLLPAEEKYGIVSQINRAAVSIPSNIAEGSSRESDKDYKRFLEIALGSVFEVNTQLIIIKKLNLVKEEQINRIFVLLEEESKMISSFIKTLKAGG